MNEQAQLTVVELEPGLACLFGEAVPEGLDLEKAVLLPDSVLDEVTRSLATVAAVGDVAAQASTLGAAMQGLVRLTPETLRALETLTPMTNAAGASLGVATDASGKIAHVMQYVDAGPLTWSSAAATMGPSIAMLAMQMQLAEIRAVAEANLRLADKTLSEIRIERWAEVKGFYEAMRRAVDEAQHIGGVTDHVWQNVHGQEAQLDKLRSEFSAKVAAHGQSMLTQSHVERREYLEHHCDAIIRDSQALLMAQAAWLLYQGIRAGHIHSSSGEGSKDRQLMERIVSEAREVHDRDVATVTRLLSELHRTFSLIAELPARRTLPFSKSRRAAADVTRMSRLLLDELPSAGSATVSPAVPTPVLMAVPEEAPEPALKLLRWHLDASEPLLALTECRQEDMLKSITGAATTYLVVTDRRLIVAEKKELLETGLLLHDIPLADVRFVRFVPPADAKTNGRLDVITVGTNLSLGFEPWSAAGPASDEVADIVRLLKSFMNLPPAEVPTAPASVRPRLETLELSGSSTPAVRS